MPRLLAFCGIDGSGKSTQAQLLASYLAQKSVPCVCLKQPSALYRNHDMVRRRLDSHDRSVSPQFLSLFAAADRLLQQQSEIEPALSAGKFVLMDRYVFSSYAYMHARGVEDYAWLLSINRYARRPDAVFYLDLDPRIALERVIKRDGQSKKKEEQDIDVIRVVRERFLALAHEHQFVTLSGELPAHTNHQAVLKTLRQLGYLP